VSYQKTRFSEKETKTIYGPFAVSDTSKVSGCLEGMEGGVGLSADSLVTECQECSDESDDPNWDKKRSKQSGETRNRTLETKIVWLVNQTRFSCV